MATLALIGNVVLWRQLVLMERELEKNASSIEKEGQITYLSHMSTDKKLQMFEQRLRALTDDPMLVAQKAHESAPVTASMPKVTATKVATVIDDELTYDPSLIQPVTPQPATPQQATTAEPATAADSASSMVNASNLFDQGVQTEEVARRCGLTRAEAELMALVQDKTKIAS